MSFYAVGVTAQDSISEPLDVNREVHQTNLSNSSPQTVELDRQGQNGCFNIRVYDPSTEKQLEKPWNYTDQVLDCEIELYEYYSDDVQTHDVSVSYTTTVQDSVAVVSMAGFTSILDVLASGIGVLASAIIFILLLPRIYRAIRVGGS